MRHIVNYLWMASCLPHRWVNFIFPIGFDELDEESTDDNNDRAECIAENVKEHTAHVQLRAGFCVTSSTQFNAISTLYPVLYYTTPCPEKNETNDILGITLTKYFHNLWHNSC